MKTFSCAAGLALAMAVHPVSAQSLAEIARVEAARRKALPKAGKQYTNEDLKADPGSTPSPRGDVAPPAPGGAQTEPASAQAQPSPAQGQAQAAGATPANEEIRDEAWWRARINAARDGLARAQTFHEALQSRINALSNDFVSRDDPAQRAAIAADRQKALAELERVTGEIGAFQKEIAAIPEEARRAGVPPGWVR